MENRDPYLNISPLDHRYWAANRELFDTLSQTLSEKAAVRYLVRAELSLLKAHIRTSLNGDEDLYASIDGLEDRIDPEEVAREEETTRHNIRALVNVIQRHIPESLAPWVHLGATSVDILDTAMAMRVRDAMRGCVIPLILDLLDSMIRLAESESETPQAGRTHGQLAVPITFGFAMAEYVSRLGQSVRELTRLSGELRGKLAGAVGAYNATSLITRDPEALEDEYLSMLGLKRADYANQIVEPEHLLRLLLEVNVTFGIIANLADDLRHLQRSEIGEVTESFGQGQVGSSTMPQKRNPWNSEHVKSLWKAFAPRVMTFYMDQISEHQRDLSNSASGRFVTDYIAGFAAAAARMKKVVDGLAVRKEKMAENLSGLGEGVLAEPTYILLALSGYADAHEIVRSSTLEADSSGRSLSQVLKEDEPEIWRILSERLQDVIGVDAKDFYGKPSAYSGLAAKRARDLARKYRDISSELRNEVKK
ncbi:MAG: lyase family protein [Spirochaetaceae bacterium]|nr:lyase family protein [Spirochaetaceae bacterium]MDT8298153.1 lyase family protein [Spirochaetaceae bacterium]